MTFPVYLFPVYCVGFVIGFCAAALEPLPVHQHWEDWSYYD